MSTFMRKKVKKQFIKDNKSKLQKVYLVLEDALIAAQILNKELNLDDYSDTVAVHKILPEFLGYHLILNTSPFLNHLR